MDYLKIINAAVILIGIPAIVGVLIRTGRKLQILATLETTVEKIKVNVKVISDYLTKHQSEFDPKELRVYSPIQLTDVGRKFITEIGFDNVFEKNKDDFLCFVEKENPRLKYDVELAAIKSIHINSQKEYMSFLKVFFYNNPTRTMDNTAPTLGVYVRDKYLAQHPEITQ